MANTKRNEYTLSFTGMFGVGKSTMIARLAGKKGPDENGDWRFPNGRATLVESVVLPTTTLADRDKVKITARDTMGMERQGNLSRQHYQRTDGVVCVYSEKDGLSAAMLKSTYICDAERATAGRALLFLVANKDDDNNSEELEARMENEFKSYSFAQKFTVSATNRNDPRLENALKQMAQLMHARRTANRPVMPPDPPIDLDRDEEPQGRKSCC